MGTQRPEKGRSSYVGPARSATGRIHATTPLVELLIDRVIVTDGEVEIRYVMPTDRASEQVRFCHLRLDYTLFTPESENPWAR